MIRWEVLIMAIGKINGCFDDPSSKSFKLCNPLLLKTYRPEKKADGDHYRIFSSVMGGFKAAIADANAKCDGKNNKLTGSNTLRDLLQFYGFKTDLSSRPIILFLRRAFDDSVSLDIPLSWFQEAEPEEKVMEKEN